MKTESEELKRWLQWWLVKNESAPQSWCWPWHSFQLHQLQPSSAEQTSTKQNPAVTKHETDVRKIQWRLGSHAAAHPHLYLLRVHDVNRQVEGPQHHVTVAIAIMWCTLGGGGGMAAASTLYPPGGSTYTRRTGYGGLRWGTLHQVNYLPIYIWGRKEIIICWKTSTGRSFFVTIISFIYLINSFQCCFYLGSGNLW